MNPCIRNIEGQRFGRLVALELLPTRIRNNAVWRFQCDCGITIERASGGVIRGSTASCGCLARESAGARMKRLSPAMNKARATHNHSHSNAGRPTKTFTTWVNMIQRCTNSKHKSFHRYGGRGITVCERWMTFENFLADMGEKPPRMELDRECNAEGYKPENCRWVNRVQNANNRDVNHAITFDGRTQNIKQWAQELGCHHQSIAYRLKKGWSVEDAFGTPFNHGNGWLRGTR